jgi:ABC-2 type transport system permease protein
VGVVDHDQGSVISGELQDLLEASDVIRPVLLEGDEAANAAEAVRDEEWAAVVIVPAGYSAQTLAGEEIELTVIVDHNTQAGRTAHGAVQAATMRLLGSVQAARISADIFGTSDQAHVEQTLALALGAWQNSPLSIEVEKGRESSEDDEKDNPYTHSSPGMMVQFAIFGLMTSSMVLVTERSSGALRRLMTTPIRRAEVIAGHVLSAFVVSFGQLALLVAVGQLAFDVEYAREPLAILLMMVALALLTTSLGLLVGAISKNEDQVVMFSMIAMMVLSAMGGAWFPLDITGKAFSAVGHITPTAWAMDGFQNIVQRGLDASSVLVPAGILLAYALAFFALAVWRFRIE